MKPANLLVIMSDQHNPQITGCYGDPVVQTPHLDALAARGTRFAHAYCPTPICVPSRASFATGRYAHQIGAWDNAAPYSGAEAPSWGHRLTAQGHHVTTIGKLHFRAQDDPNGFPDQRLPMHVAGGVGDLYALLRGEMPVRPNSREQIYAAAAGESEYIRYDRAIAQAGARWLRDEAPRHRQPWCLYVSFVTPHFPLIVPEDYLARYRAAPISPPVQGDPQDWHHHPVLDRYRALQALDTPIDDSALRTAMAAYYGLVTFMDEQVGSVLQALDEAELRDTTRVIYTSDHGEQLGAHGFWWKSTMYEGCASVPLIIAGPEVPAGKVVNTNVTLLDSFPTIAEAVGAALLPEDADLPGESLWALAQAPHRDRTVFSEYHAIFSPTGIFMLRDGRYKYVYYAGGYPPQLFDLIDDPHEEIDLAGDPGNATLLARLHQRLCAICDPEEVDRRAKADQRERLKAGGGAEAIRAAGVTIPYSPPPGEFAQ